MTELYGRPSTGPGCPAWGGGHLALDAIVAYVDEELSVGAQRRALEHLSRCPECATEVVAQTQARIALRASSTPILPSSLLHNLRDIPSQTALPEPPAGLSIGPDGEFVQLQRLPRAPRRRTWLGAGAVVSGLAIGALVVVGNMISPPGLSSARVLPRAVFVAPRSQHDQELWVQGVMFAPSAGTAPAARSSASSVARLSASTPARPPLLGHAAPH
jgi:anti-sigma factor RsiW